MDVQIGNEGYVFESGPFTSFGKQVGSDFHTLQLIFFPHHHQVLILPEDETSPRPAIWTPEVTLIPRGEVLYLKVFLFHYYLKTSEQNIIGAVRDLQSCGACQQGRW